MNRKNVKGLIIALAVGLTIALGLAEPAAAAGQPIIRWPSAAGAHYPAEPEKLLSTLQELYARADAPELSSHLAAVIASPSPYGLAGAISAHAFKNLKPGQYERVIVIAPSHGISFENCSIPAVDVYLTPLGPVPLDAPALRYILFSPLFQAHQVRYDNKKVEERVHEYEYAIEALLPYLQERLQEFKLVPILVGDLRDPQGRVSENTISAIADVIRPIINKRTLVVVSSNFTHYGAVYGHQPADENALDAIARLDRRAFEALLALDLTAFRTYLEETNNIIDGRECIQIMLNLLPPGTQSRILAYETSAALTGQTAQSVSYAAFTFHDPSQPMLPARPDKVRPLVLRRPERIVSPPETSTAAESPPAQPENVPIPKVSAPSGGLGESPVHIEQAPLPYPQKK